MERNESLKVKCGSCGEDTAYDYFNEEDHNQLCPECSKIVSIYGNSRVLAWQEEYNEDCFIVNGHKQRKNNNGKNHLYDLPVDQDDEVEQAFIDYYEFLISENYL